MRFNDLLHLIAFPGKAHGTPPAPGFVTATKMPEPRALSKFSDHFSRYIPLSGGVMMSVREIERYLEQWQMGIRDWHGRTILALTPRERERWQAIWLLAQGWTASVTAEALERDPHTIGRWAAAFGEGGPRALIFERSGGSPRSRQGRAGGVEGSGARVAGYIWNRLGQLDPSADSRGR